MLDGVVVLFDAVSGVEPQSETVWRQADRYFKFPVPLFLTDFACHDALPFYFIGLRLSPHFL